MRVYGKYVAKVRMPPLARQVGWGRGSRLWRLGIRHTAHAAALHTTVLGFFAATIIPCHILQLDSGLFKTINRAMGGAARAA